MSQQFVVKVGQVWGHPEYNHRWKIHRIHRSNIYAELAYCDRDGNFTFDNMQHSLGPVDEHGYYNGFQIGWIIVDGNDNGACSKVNPKTLRKRARDLIAQRVLSGGDPSPNVAKTKV